MKGERLGNLCSVSFRGMQLNVDPEYGEIHHILSVKDLQDGRINFSDVREEPIVVSKKKKQQALADGDLIITLRGTSFKAAIFDLWRSDPNYRRNDNQTYLDENLACFRVTRCQPKIIAAYLNSPIGQQYLEQMSTGTRVRSLSMKSLENLRVPMVPWEIQQELVRFLDSADQYMQQIEYERQALARACNAVIGTYMEGY